MPWPKCPISEKWFQLRDALNPLYFFTTKIEANMVPLGIGYNEFVTLKNKLHKLIDEGNPFASDLSDIVDER